MEQLDGLAHADVHLGRPVPLPRVPLPLARWVEVFAVADDAVEVAWNLDDTRDGAPGRLALFAGRTAPAARDLGEGTTTACDLGDGVVHRHAPLAEAQDTLRPVHELRWHGAGLHLRLTAQGPWALEELRAIARSVA